MNFQKNRGQGVAEYLLILAVVITVGVVVVNLMLNFTLPIDRISVATSQINATTSPIAINEAVVDFEGNHFLKIKNNTGENLTITKIIVGNTSSEQSAPLPNNGEIAFIINEPVFCIKGMTITQNVTLNYSNQENFQKIQTYSLPIYFECTNYTSKTNYFDEEGIFRDPSGQPI
jgi:hypothetical protein